MNVLEIPFGKESQRFIQVAHHIYQNDPQWVAPLDLDMKDRLNPKKNPFFEHGEGVTFIATKDGKDVGRITAQSCRNHLAIHKDNTAFFGYLDTIDDVEVCQGLLDAASKWAKNKGFQRIMGPFSLSTNEEIGLLIDGYDIPPMVYMPHHLPYQKDLVEKTGFTKCKDLFAWRYVVGEIPSRARRAHDEVLKYPEVRTRSVKLSDIDREVVRVMEVFNDAWQDHWGFVPMTQAELKKLASDLRLIMIPDMAMILEVNGEPAAISIVLPNVNELIADLKGKLFPLGLIKLLWRLKVKGAEGGRLAILGVKKKFRTQKRYMSLSTALYVETSHRAQKHGMTWGELSWTLEDNHPVNLAIKMMGGTIYKKYRVYEKNL